MAGISEDERLRLEEERLSKTLLKGGTSGKKMNFVSKPAEAKQPTPAAPKTTTAAAPRSNAPRALVHTGATDNVAAREEGRLANTLSKPVQPDPSHAHPRHKPHAKELTEEEKARIKAHEELMKKREEEARAAAELERKHAERRAQDELERKNRSYHSAFYGTEIKPFRTGGDSQVPEPVSNPPPDLAKAPLQDFTSTLLTLTGQRTSTTGTKTTAAPAPTPAPAPAPQKVAEPPKPKAVETVVSVEASRSSTDDEGAAQSRSMKNLFKNFNTTPSSVSAAPPTTSYTAPVSTQPVYTAPAPAPKKEEVYTPPAPQVSSYSSSSSSASTSSSSNFLPPPPMMAAPPPPPAPFVYDPPAPSSSSSSKSRAQSNLEDIDALISGIDRSVAESAADAARKEAEHRAREAERMQREQEEMKRRVVEEEQRRVEAARLVEEQRVQLERQRKDREALEEAKKQRAREEEERRMQYNAEYDRQQAEREEEMQQRVRAMRTLEGVNLSLDERPSQPPPSTIDDPSVNVRQLALQSIQASVTRLRMADTLLDSEATELLKSLPSTSSALTELLVPFLQPAALQALRSNQIDWAAMARHLARVTEAARHASLVSPQSAEHLVPLADELLTQASSLVATAGAWIHTGGDGTHVQDNCKALLATLLQLIRATKTALSSTPPVEPPPAQTPLYTPPVYSVPQVEAVAPARVPSPTPLMKPDSRGPGQAVQLQPPQLHSPFSPSDDSPHAATEFVNNIAASGKRLLTLITSFSEGADIGATIAAFVDSLQAVQSNVSDVAMVFNADDGKTLVELTKGLMQYGLDFVRQVRLHSTQGTELDFDQASAKVRAQLLDLLHALAAADKNHKASGPVAAAAPPAPAVAENPAVAELNAHGRRLDIILNEPELDGDGFIAEMKLLIGVARSAQANLPDGPSKDRIGIAAKSLLQRGIAYRSSQSPDAKQAVLDAVGELANAVRDA